MLGVQKHTACNSHIIEKIFIIFARMNNSPIILSLVVWMLVSSCVETIVMDPKEDAPAVVFCVLNDTSSVQRMQLLRSARPSEREALIPIPEEDVVRARLYATETRSRDFHYKGNGTWETTDFWVLYGQRCHLEVELSDGQIFTAQTDFPERWDVFRLNGWNLYKVSKKKEREMHDSILCGPVPYWVTQYHLQSGGERHYSEFLLTTHPFVDRFNATSLCFSDMDCFRSDVWEKAGMNSLYSHTFYPYLNPDSRLFWRAVRIFFPREIETEEDKAENRKALKDWTMIDEIDRSELFFVLGEYDSDFAIRHRAETGFRPELFTEIRIVSNDYDQFLKDIYKQGLSMESGDLFETMYNRQEIACNIHGGAKGFFGAESIHIFPYHYELENWIKEDGTIGSRWITR